MPSLELFAELFVLGIIVLVFALAYFWKLTSISATEALHKFFEKNQEIDKLLVTALVVGASYGAGAVVDQLAYVFMEMETPMNIVAGPIVGLLGIFPRDIRDSIEKSTSPDEAYQLNHYGWMRGTYRAQFARAVVGETFSEIPKMTHRSQSRRKEEPNAGVCEDFCKQTSTSSTSLPTTSGTVASATPATSGTLAATQLRQVATCLKSCGVTLDGASTKEQRRTLGKKCLEPGTKTKDTEQDCNFLNLWLQHEKSSEGKAASWFKRTNTLYRIARGIMFVSFGALMCTVLVMVFDLILSLSKAASRKAKTIRSSSKAASQEENPVLSLSKAESKAEITYHVGGLVLAFLLIAPCAIAGVADARPLYQCIGSWLSIGTWAVMSVVFLYDEYRKKPDSQWSATAHHSAHPDGPTEPSTPPVLKSHLKLLVTAYLLCFLSYTAMIRAEIDFHVDVWFGAIEAVERTGAKGD